MRITRKALWTAALTALLCPVASRGEGSKPAPSPAPPIIYNQPDSGDDDIGTNRSGEARGGGVDTSLIAMVPTKVSYTTKEQPSLFWFQSKDAPASLELALIEPGKPNPLMMLTARSGKPGIHRIRLANHGIKLSPDTKYKWSVSIIRNPSSRSEDIVANGLVRRIEPSKELVQKLAAAKPAEVPAIYAQAGIWYDALEAISDEIDKDPGNSSLRKERAALLQQIGLPALE